MKKPLYLITCAWPYANGSLHVGHAAALLPADILARYYSQQGCAVLFVSGTDSHGTPITVRAIQEQVTPESIATRYHKEFERNFKALGFSFDEHGLYSTTTSKTHKETVQKIFLELYNKGFIEKRKEIGYWSEQDARFLPDRYIEGECPHCHFDNARGDQCDSCGTLLDPRDLINPKSKLSGDTPVERETEHLYLLLSKLEPELRTYLNTLSHVRANTKEFTSQYMKHGLQDRAITRDIEWGVEVPIPGFEHKRIYVWFEAVCGYLSASIEWAQTQKKSDVWKDFWLNPNCASFYVYGKDNIPFHTIIWPSILLGYDTAYVRPQVHVASEYVQIEGKKLSTSRNWAVWIPDLLKAFDQNMIRFALIAFGPETSDTNFSFSEFQKKYNTEFVATLGNYIQRVIKLAQRLGVKEVAQNQGITKEDSHVFTDVARAVEQARFREALTKILEFASEGNKFLDREAPWKQAKENPKQVKETLVVALRKAAQFAFLLSPFLPDASKKLEALFSLSKHTISYYTGTISLGEVPEVLFPQISDECIAQESARLKQ